MAAPYSTTLRQFLLDLGQLFDDAKLLTASGGTTQTFVTDQLSGQAGADFAGSELFLWTAPAGMTATNPLYVDDQGAANTLRFPSVIGPNPITAPLQGVLQNINGQGFSQDKKLFAARMALEEDYPLARGLVQITSGWDTTNYMLAIPAGIRSVQRVWVVKGNEQWEVGPHIWRDIDLDARKLYVPYALSDGDAVKIAGRYDPSSAWGTTPNMTTPIDVSTPDLLAAAQKWLLLSRRDKRDRENLQVMYTDRERHRRDLPMTNEVFLV